jgi:hypothetical protein
LGVGWEVNSSLRLARGRSRFEPPEESGISSGDQAIDELRAQVEQLARRVAAPAGKPVQSAHQVEPVSLGCPGPRVTIMWSLLMRAGSCSN